MFQGLRSLHGLLYWRGRTQRLPALVPRLRGRLRTVRAAAWPELAVRRAKLRNVRGNLRGLRRGMRKAQTASLPRLRTSLPPLRGGLSPDGL